MPLPSPLASDPENVENWPMAKRKRVESSLLDETISGVSHHEQVAYKRWRASQLAEPQEMPNTAKKSGGDAKREFARSENSKDKENTKVALLDDWRQKNWGSKDFRNLLTCCAVDELQATLDKVGESRSVHQIARDVVDSGDFDGAEPPLNARKLVTIMRKMEENPHYTPMCQGGRPTILNSSTAKSFWQFIESELKKRNPSGQSSVTDQEKFIKECWLKFYCKNDGVQAPDIKPKTMARCREMILQFGGAEPGKKKNVRGAEAMDDPRNFIAFAAVCSATMECVPDDLKLNYDDVTFMVAEDIGVVKICYAHKDVIAAMRELGRSLAWTIEQDGPSKQVRMFVCGFLSTGAGRLPAVIVKFYDRVIVQKERIMLHHIGTAGNGAEMYWVNIKLNKDGDGSNDDEEVNRLVMRDVVAKEVEANKQRYIAESRRIIEAAEQGHAQSPIPHVSTAAAGRESESDTMAFNDDYRSDLSDAEGDDASQEEELAPHDQVSRKFFSHTAKTIPPDSG
jgi:hypothetical protein